MIFFLLSGCSKEPFSALSPLFQGDRGVEGMPGPLGLSGPPVSSTVLLITKIVHLLHTSNSVNCMSVEASVD